MWNPLACLSEAVVLGDVCSGDGVKTASHPSDSALFFREGEILPRDAVGAQIARPQDASATSDLDNRSASEDGGIDDDYKASVIVSSYRHVVKRSRINRFKIRETRSRAIPLNSSNARASQRKGPTRPARRSANALRSYVQLRNAHRGLQHGRPCDSSRLSPPSQIRRRYLSGNADARHHTHLRKGRFSGRIHDWIARSAASKTRSCWAIAFSCEPHFRKPQGNPLPVTCRCGGGLSAP